MEEFINNYIKKLESTLFDVQVSTKRYPMHAIQTTFGVKPFQNETDALGYLIFIDLCTIANWSHPCTYIFYVSETEYYVASENWMPHESLHLMPFTIGD